MDSPAAADAPLRAQLPVCPGRRRADETLRGDWLTEQREDRPLPKRWPSRVRREPVDWPAWRFRQAQMTRRSFMPAAEFHGQWWHHHLEARAWGHGSRIFPSPRTEFPHEWWLGLYRFRRTSRMWVARKSEQAASIDAAQALEIASWAADAEL